MGARGHGAACWEPTISTNALAALAIARSLGLALEEGLRALGELRPPQRRLERKRFGEIEVLDDCYNANPHVGARRDPRPRGAARRGAADPRTWEDA